MERGHHPLSALLFIRRASLRPLFEGVSVFHAAASRVPDGDDAAQVVVQGCLDQRLRNALADWATSGGVSGAPQTRTLYQCHRR